VLSRMPGRSMTPFVSCSHTATSRPGNRAGSCSLLVPLRSGSRCHPVACNGRTTHARPSPPRRRRHARPPAGTARHSRQWVRFPPPPQLFPTGSAFAAFPAGFLFRRCSVPLPLVTEIGIRPSFKSVSRAEPWTLSRVSPRTLRIRSAESGGPSRVFSTAGEELLRETLEARHRSFVQRSWSNACAERTGCACGRPAAAPGVCCLEGASDWLVRVA
jgi:hypothetical protein